MSFYDKNMQKDRLSWNNTWKRKWDSRMPVDWRAQDKKKISEHKFVVNLFDWFDLGLVPDDVAC